MSKQGQLPGLAIREVLPVIAEHLEVSGVRIVETARVLVRKRVKEESRLFEKELARDEVLVERVSIDRIVDRADPIRTDGDTTIVPVYEEVLVKQLVLKEELRITRRRKVEVRTCGPVVLRREELEITRALVRDAPRPAEAQSASDRSIPIPKE